MPENTLDRFKELEGGLEETIGLSRLPVDHSEDPKSKITWRDNASSLYREYAPALQEAGISPLTDQTPEVSVDRLYQAVIKIKNEASKGFFEQHKKAIIASLDEKVLADNVLGIPHAKNDKDEEHNNRVGAIMAYDEIKTINQAYDSDAPINGRKVTDADLLKRAQKYVVEQIDKRLGKDNSDHRENKHVSDKARKELKAIMLNILASTPKAGRIITTAIEADAKEKYEKALPDDYTRAETVRRSLMYQEKENKAREFVYKLSDSED